MKKLLILSFIAAFSFGFTLTSDTGSNFKSDCPYLNEIHSAQKIDSDACPYLEENKSEMKSGECPYIGSKQKREVECPYLKEKGETVNEEFKPVKQIILKSS